MVIIWVNFCSNGDKRVKHRCVWGCVCTFYFYFSILALILVVVTVRSHAKTHPSNINWFAIERVLFNL